ncbi:MAG: hypothetical protein WCF36_08780 [Candidatus Nanopelagicales bacterium]
MEFDLVISALLRRWYLVMVGISVTAGLVFAAYTAVPRTYSATGTSVVLPPAKSIPNGANILLQLGGLEQPASLVVAYLAGEAPRIAFAEKYPDAHYDVVVDPLSRGPLIIVTVESPHEDEVVAALKTALATVPEGLAAIQDAVNVPSTARLQSSTLIVDVEPTTKSSNSLRAMIAVAAAGIALTLVLAVGADRLLAQRASRRKEESASRHDGTETDKVEDTVDDEVTAATDADRPEEPIPGTESGASDGWHVRVSTPEL